MKIPEDLFFSKAERFPHPDWDGIAKIVEVETTGPEESHAAWVTVAGLWMKCFARVLGTDYQVRDSDHFVLVSRAGPERANEVLRFLEDCHRRIHEALPFLETGGLCGKCPVIVFGDEYEFYEYFAAFQDCEEGEFGGAGGVYLNRGYGHFAMPSEELGWYRATMCHELCHALLAPFNLPLWLDEAVTMEIEHRIVGEDPYVLDRETIREHRDYWNGERIEAFWTGESFAFPDEGQKLSYHLARYLFHALVARSAPGAMAGFLASGNWDDCGYSAALDHFGVDLVEILDGLLA